MHTYRVMAPYILLKVRDEAGKPIVAGFYEGAIVVDPIDDYQGLRKAVERNWVERVGPETPKGTVTPPPDGGEDQVPDGTAEKVLTWVGGNPERAALALAAEQASVKPRTTLIGQLRQLVDQA